MRKRWTDTEVTPIWHGSAEADLNFDILADQEALSNAMARCDAVCLLAGVTQEGGKRPLSANTELARAVLASGGSKPVFLCSTAAVYGRAEGRLAESIKPVPVSPYGKAKRDMELVATKHPNAIILRIGNVAGADALLGFDREPYHLTTFPDGETPVRSYIGPTLLARVISRLSRIAVDGGRPSTPLNIAGPTPVSMAELLAAADKSWVSVPPQPDTIRRVELNTDALWDLLGEPALSYGAEKIVADWRGSGA